MPLWTKRAVVLLAVATVALLLLPGSRSQDFLQCAIQVCCLAIAWHHVLQHRSVIRLGWGLLVVAVSTLALSDMMGVVERQFWDLRAHPSPSNVLALIGYSMLGLAVFRLDRNRSRGRSLPGGIEAAIFATGALAPVLVFLVIPVLGSDTLSAGAQLVTAAYALADLVVVTVIARLMLTDGGQSRAFIYLSAALFFSLAGDLISWANSATGPDGDLAIVKTLWLLGFVTFAAGIAHPSMETFTSSGGSWSQDAPRRRRVWLMGVGQALPAVTLMASWAMGRSSSLLIIAALGLAASLLVSARMNGLLDQISAQSTQLAGLARSDELTGLHNRRSWNFELARACASAEEQQTTLGVALIDLDRFKSYNDTYGHPAGDRLLKAAAESWQAALRPGEVLARYGGEEFAMLVPGATLEQAVQRADTLRKLTPGGQTFSAGVAMWVVGTEPEQSVADADTALYTAKRQGRNRVVAYHGAPAKSAPHLPYSLRTVVQPIVRMRDLSVAAYEALSRFDPATDVEAVFDQAHEEGYGDLLESSAILSGLRFPDRPEGVEVFVNVSERAMVSPHFWGTIPARLEGVMVELHETRHGLDDTAVAGMLERFRHRGARVCLDDLVATGDDLDRIVSLRPDMIKVDRSLVAGCHERPEQVGQIKRLLSVARQYGVDVCAEGVEQVEELATLRAIGVPFVQGYLLGRPEPFWIEPLGPSITLGARLKEAEAAAATDAEPVSQRSRTALTRGPAS